MNNRYVVIIAGGAGTRLWPLSRSQSPKQFQNLTGAETLIQHMARLASHVVPAENTYVMTVDTFAPLVREQLSGIPAENVLTEPARRDNGPAIALATLHMEKLHPGAHIAFLWSDHLVQSAEGFASTLTAAFEASEKNPTYTVMCGAKPTIPDTGLGYIQMGKEVQRSSADVPIFEVSGFFEKPDLKTAQQYVSSWEFLWNMGYHVVSVKGFMENLLAANPDLGDTIESLREAVRSGADLREAYEQMPKLAIDYLYTQKQRNILVVPSDMGWSDVGNWNILHEELQRSPKEVVTQGEVINVSSTNSLVFAKDRPIAIVGIENLIVVDSGDAILIMSKEAAQQAKVLNAELAERHPELL